MFIFKLIINVFHFNHNQTQQLKHISPHTHTHTYINNFYYQNIINISYNNATTNKAQRAYAKIKDFLNIINTKLTDIN